MIRTATWLVLVSLGLFGCTQITKVVRHDPRAQALALAAQAGLEHNTIPAGPFRLLTFSRGLATATSLIIYVEGDGHAWRSRRVPSSDPTPREPISLRLAALDESPSVLYLARPCQFLMPEELAQCDRKYWTSHRYSPGVISAMNSAIDSVLSSERMNGKAISIGLVGHSGGGTIAALIAASRDDVAWLVTVAGNLDHEAWTKWHGVTPLFESLNPADAIMQLHGIPQVHLLGERDQIVPSSVVDSFRSRLGNRAQVVVETVSDFDHRCCWEKVWPEIACRYLAALGKIGFTPCRSGAAESNASNEAAPNTAR